MKIHLKDVTKFKEVEVCDRKALTVDERIIYVHDLDSDYSNVYAYDIRHDDIGNPVAIEPYNSVLVNFWGTLITYKPIDLGKDNYIIVDFNFIDELEGINPIEYMNKLHDEDNHHEEVLGFIDEIIKQAELRNNPKIDLNALFADDYCFHFANVLKSVFKRGELYICSPCGDVVWRDEDNRYYNFNGEYKNKEVTFIPDPDSYWTMFHNTDSTENVEDGIYGLAREYMRKFPNI